jgi:hypothetical protein
VDANENASKVEQQHQETSAVGIVVNFINSNPKGMAYSQEEECFRDHRDTRITDNTATD